MLQHLMRRAHQAAIGRRFVTLCGALLPHEKHLTEYSESSFASFLLNEKYSEHLRSFIGWFSATGAMPNEEEENSLSVLLATRNSAQVLKWLYFHAVSGGKTARYRTIQVTDLPIYDCTNVSAIEGRLTGIPRVSHHFLNENPSLHQQCFAWSDSVMGPLDYSPQEGFTKTRTVWPNSGGVFDLSRLTRNATEWLSRRAYSTSTRIGYYMILVAGLLASWLLLSVFRMRGPGPKVAIMPLSHVWILETVSSDAASRYIALTKSHSETRISLMIYDLLPIQIPGNFLPIAVEHYVHQLRLMTRCKTLLTDSAHLPSIVEGALHMMGSETMPEIVPRPLHIDPKWVAPSPSKPPANIRFLQIGALESRKNHHLAISAFTQLPHPGRRFSIVGKERRPSRLISELLDAVDKTAGMVEFLYGLTDEQIIDISQSTTAMVYPSIAEGYGLPIIEGLAMGLPVIASDIPPHRQFSDIGGIIYFEPSSAASLAQAMGVLADPEENWRLRSSIRFDRIPANPREWAVETRRVLEA